MPKSKRKLLYDELSSFDSLSSISSQYSSDEQPTDEMPKLSKIQLRQLVKLEQKIKQQQEKLKLLTNCQSKSVKKSIQKSKKHSSKQYRQKSPGNVLGFLKTDQNEPLQSKVYLTGFNENVSLDILKSEIKALLIPFRGMCQYKIKLKKNQLPYTILIFQSDQLANKAAKMIKKVKIGGSRINVTIMKNHFKKDEQGRGKCYECQEYGHLGRSCPIRLQKHKNSGQYLSDSTEYQDIRRNMDVKQQICSSRRQQQVETEPPRKQLDNRKQQQKGRRIVRDKSRLNKIIGDNF